jgi:CO/xanthine dehydrogenase FAD-binding subunit
VGRAQFVAIPVRSRRPTSTSAQAASRSQAGNEPAGGGAGINPTLEGRCQVLEPHVALPEFDYIKPESLKDASRFLAEHAADSRPLLGGTDIFVRMRDGTWQDKYLVDIKGLDGLGALAFDPERGLTIGAAVSMNRALSMPEVRQHYPLLAQAVGTVASYQLRSRATIVGNICNASPAGDTIGACLVHDGALAIHTTNASYQLPLAEFFRGPGQTALEPGDIVTSIHLPLPAPGSIGHYEKLGRNQMGDLAIVGVTALGHPDSNTASGYRFHLALAAVAPTPLVPTVAEGILASEPITDESIARAADAAMQACSPIDDVRGGAEYRRLMVRNLTRRAIYNVWRRLSN